MTPERQHLMTEAGEVEACRIPPEDENCITPDGHSQEGSRISSEGRYSFKLVATMLSFFISGMALSAIGVRSTKLPPYKFRIRLTCQRLLFMA